MKSAKSYLMLLVLLSVGTLSYAAPTILCTEDPANGCVASIPTSNPLLLVASDGESSFDPFGAGFDVSDGIQLNSNWLPNTAYPGMITPGFWTQLPNTFTWVLPSVTPCGVENEPVCEPLGAWYFPGTKWSQGTPNLLVMLEGNGTWSDVIKVDNRGPGGSAEIIFNSAVPEPGSLALLSSGLLGLVGVVRRKLVL